MNECFSRRDNQDNPMASDISSSVTRPPVKTHSVDLHHQEAKQTHHHHHHHGPLERQNCLQLPEERAPFLRRLVLCCHLSGLSSLLTSGPPRPPSFSPPRTTKMFTRSQPTPVQTVWGPRGTFPTPTLPMPREEAAPPGKIPDLVRTLSSPVSLPTSGL